MSASTDMQMTAFTRGLLERIARLNPKAGEIGAGMLASIVEGAEEALRREGAARFMVTVSHGDFIKGEVVTVESINPMGVNNAVFAQSRDWQTQGDIPFANLELIGQPE